MAHCCDIWDDFLFKYKSFESFMILYFYESKVKFHIKIRHICKDEWHIFPDCNQLFLLKNLSTEDPGSGWNILIMDSNSFSTRKYNKLILSKQN